MDARELVIRMMSMVETKYGGVSPQVAIAIKAWTGVALSAATVHPDGGLTILTYTEDGAREIAAAFGVTHYVLTPVSAHSVMLHIADLMLDLVAPAA